MKSTEQYGPVKSKPMELEDSRNIDFCCLRCSNRWIEFLCTNIYWVQFSAKMMWLDERWSYYLPAIEM